MANEAPETLSFFARVGTLPAGPICLDTVLQPSIEDESALRHLWAVDKSHPRLSNPHVGLVDIFDAPSYIRKTHPRDIDQGHAHYIFPLQRENRRTEGQPCFVDSLEQFKFNWELFTEGSLSQMHDWNNVIACGGSVQACLTPFPPDITNSQCHKRAVRNWYHYLKYPTSDVDLFLWGLNKDQAERKIVEIYECVRNSVFGDVTCVRTKHAITIYSQFPCRPIQIILRLYSSPTEILSGFDIDATCFGYNGSRVLANPRSIIASMRQCNTTDITRRSPSYEVRLAKYARRGFEVYVPNLRRDMVNPTIFEKPMSETCGLARLLVLDKFSDGRYPLADRNDLVDTGLEANSYDCRHLHIPYGPGWGASRVNTLIHRINSRMNSLFNPSNMNRKLHRHPAFFGTALQCMEDCCGECPAPTNEDEDRLQKDEDHFFIRGRITFLDQNPGRQSISGSFNPINDGEWEKQAYSAGDINIGDNGEDENILNIQDQATQAEDDTDDSDRGSLVGAGTYPIIYVNLSVTLQFSQT